MFESSSCVDKEVVFGSVVVEMKFVSFPVGMEKVLKNLHLHTVKLHYYYTYCHKNQFILKFINEHVQHFVRMFGKNRTEKTCL